MNLIPKKYKDYVEECVSNLTIEKLEEQIKNSKYIKIQSRDKKIENAKGLPMLIDTFYDFLTKEERIPTYKEFEDLWIKKTYSKFKLKLDKNQKIYKFFRGRASRTYPSIVRDLHFRFLSKENIEKGDDAIFNRELDSKHQIDLLLIINNKYYGLKLFTKTKNAIDYANQKPFRIVYPFTNVKYFKVKINLSKNNTIIKTGVDYNGKEYHPIYLYNITHLNLIKEKIEIYNMRIKKLNDISNLTNFIKNKIN